MEGADCETGEERTVRVRATSRANAEVRANALGLLVSRVCEHPPYVAHVGPPSDLTIAEFGRRLADAPATLFLAIVIFAASWFLPVVAISPININGFQACGVSFDVTMHATRIFRASRRDSERFPAEVVRYSRATSTDLPDAWDLANLVSVVWFATAWVLNLAFAVIVWLCIIRRWITLVFPVALVMAMWSAVGIYSPLERGISTSYSIGYYLWVLAFAVLAVVAFQISNRSRTVP